jgi:CheY-like chemotaxis protein
MTYRTAAAEPAGAWPPRARGALESAEALVVDDNPLNSRLVALFLKRLGWRTEVADRGDVALRMLSQRRFDLVLLDLRMPAMSGERVCRSIRDDLQLKSLRVVAYTAHSTPEEKERILAGGFDGLLIKPISFSDVKEVCDAG